MSFSVTSEPLDVDALTARAELAARAGDRERAIRILGSVVDVRPTDVAAQLRLAQLHEWAGDAPRGCAHRVAAADTRPTDASVVGPASACARAAGMNSLADSLLGEEKVRIAVARLPTLAEGDVRGDVQIRAQWDGGDDLDFALVSESGQRFSWLGGGKVRVSAVGATAPHSESTGFAGLPPGSYTVEVSSPTGPRRASGSISLRVVDKNTRVPFALDGSHKTAPATHLGRGPTGRMSAVVQDHARRW